MEAGRITLAKARIIDAETMNLADERTAAVEARVLVKARQQTPGQVRVATRRAVLCADPAAARERAEQARRERGVRMWPEPDGMATLSAYLPAADAVGVFAVVDEYARQAGLAGDERSMDARRGDALVDLVLDPTGVSSGGSAARRHAHETGGRQQSTQDASAVSRVFRGADDDVVSAPRATDPAGCRISCGRCRRGGGVDVRVTIPYTALLGANELPGDLAGYGPIPAAVARDLAPEAPGGASSPTLPPAGRWTTALPRYRPPAHLAGLVITRDQTCQFPGCRIPAHRCDIDHAIAHNPNTGTGPTSDTNLGPKCRRHHRVKQTPGWSVTHHTDGCTTWTTPSGHLPLPLPTSTTDRPRTTHQEPATRPR